MLAVDGPAGSGKTTFAAQVAAHLTEATGTAPVVIHLDDLYAGWSGGLTSGTFARVESQVLAPVRGGGRACWQRYDWTAGRFDDWREEPAANVLVLEGCGSGAWTFAASTTVLSWVEAARHTRLERGLTRDGEHLRARWLDWMRREDDHYARHRTRARADVVLTTD